MRLVVQLFYRFVKFFDIEVGNLYKYKFESHLKWDEESET